MCTRRCLSSFFANAIKKQFGILVLLLLVGSHAAAQMSHDGTTPKGMQTGAPAGSFSLSGFENINPYSGNLNFSLPLLKIGGRGGAQSSINLTIDSAKWNVNFDVETEVGTVVTGGNIYTFSDEKMIMHCVRRAGDPWTCGVNPDTGQFTNTVVLDGRIFSEAQGNFFKYVTIDDTVYGRRPGYGPGVLFSLASSRGGPRSGPFVSLTRLTFIASDGTQYELRDQKYSGQPILHTSTTPNPLSRDMTFVSAEGEGISFVSDSDIIDERSNDDGSPVVRYPSGTLYFSDGTVYKINQGNVEWIRDRNGNQIKYWYDTSNRVITIVDSLNRQVDITYGTSTNNSNDPNETYDDISYYVDGTTKRHIQVYHTKLAQALRADFRSGGPLSGLLTYGQMFPELSDYEGAAAPYNPTTPVATKVVLPDNRSYDLSYTQYNEVARVKLPTGGAIEYDFATPGSTDSHIFRPVKERRVYENGGSKYPTNSPYDLKQTFNLTPRIDSAQSYCSQADRCTDATVQEYFYDTTAENNDRLVGKTVHSYFGVPYDVDHNFYPMWREGREYQSEIYAPNSTTPLRRTIQEWDQQPVSWAVSHPEGTPPNNPRIISTTTELLDTGTSSKLVSKQVYGYDDTPAFRAFNNQTDVWEYAFGDGAPSSQLLRHTYTKYLVTDASPNPTPSPSPGPTPPDECPQCTCRDNCRLAGDSVPTAQEYVHQYLLRLRAEVRVYGVVNSQEQLQARTEFVYDETSLLSRNNITGWIDPGSLARGNVTTMKRWIIPTDDTAFVKTLAKYDVAGNVIQTTDANNAVAASPKVTAINYDDCFGTADGNARSGSNPTGLTGSTYAFPTIVVNMLEQRAYSKYDYYSGSPVTTEDANGVKTNMFYNDPLGRIKQVVQAVGTPLQKQAAFNYNDDSTSRTITTTSDLSAFGDNKLKSETIYDGLGRTITSHSYESSSSFVTTEQTYDGFGRVIRATNPYRTTSDSTYDWTDTKYDALGRIKEVKTHSDNALVKTEYAGNTVTVTDQAEKQRKSVTDALGRLTDIYEILDNAPAYQTSYAYDVLGNLLRVTQGEQTRSFVYDGLSRLKSATYPEIGTISNGSYTYGTISYDEYDSNGNLKKKTDTRGIATNYTYDSLNRQTKRNYSDNSTPEVDYYYDAQPLPTGAPVLARGRSIGQLLAVTYGGPNSINGTYYGYNEFIGRPDKSAQVTDGHEYPGMEYGCNLSGSMTSQKYPSGRIVTTQLDEVGRLSSVSGGQAGETKTYLSLPEYAPHGAITALKLGNGLWEHTQFNQRLQTTEIKIGTESNSESVLKLSYTYGVKVSGVLLASKNNGNIESQTITVPTIGTATGYTATQSYEYDALNRLQLAQETTAGEVAPSWKQTYNYDRFGNRRFSYTGGATTVPSEPTTGPEIALTNPEVTTANNRLVGYSYDAAGNVTVDAQSRTFAYDGENHQVAYNGGATINSNDTASYVYDGEGRRVKKQVGGSMAATVFVYNISGQLVAEYTDSTEPRTAQTRYVTTDTLGSTRVVTGQDQQVKERHDYFPFGEELTAGVGGRTQNQVYSQPDNIRQKFATYERDNETGLDYAQARYYGSLHGRFTSPDPRGGSLVVPQSLNRYAYVLNNPFRFIDPTGKTWEGASRRFTVYRGISGQQDGQQSGQDPQQQDGASDDDVIRINVNFCESCGDYLDANGNHIYGRAPTLANAQRSAEAAAAAAIPLWRAVRDVELQDIFNNGMTFRNPYGSEIKYFSRTPQGAVREAQSLYRTNPQEGPYTLVKTGIPEEHVTPDTQFVDSTPSGPVESVTVPTETLPVLETPVVEPVMPIDIPIIP